MNSKRPPHVDAEVFFEDGLVGVIIVDNAVIMGRGGSGTRFFTAAGG